MEEPALGDYVNSWQIPLNSNFTIIDAKFGSVSTIAFTNANVTLTNVEAAFWGFLLDGALTGAVALILPSGVAGTWIIANATTGAFTLTVKGSSGDAGVVLTQGSSQAIYSNGTNAALTISSAQVVAALGYTPANRAGDTFTGAVTFSAGLTVSTAGIAITSGPLTVSSGNVTITSGTLTVSAGLTTLSDGLSVASGATVGGGLTVSSGSTALGTTTATTVASTDQSTNVATTAFVAGAAPLVAAALSFGGVGTYAAGSIGVDVLVGQTVAGSAITVNSSGSGTVTNPLTGVWRYMGGNGSTGGRLWLRVS